MPWIESHTSLIRHSKTKSLARSLGVSRVTAMGHLHCLWHSVIEEAEDGDLSNWSKERIANAGEWDSDSAVFLDALLISGFLDKTLLIHDWLDYAGRFLTSKYKTYSRDTLVEIWAKFGRIYGKEFLRKVKGTPQEVQPYLTLPNQTLNNSNSLPDGIVTSLSKALKQEEEKYNQQFNEAYRLLPGIEPLLSPKPEKPVPKPPKAKKAPKTTSESIEAQCIYWYYKDAIRSSDRKKDCLRNIDKLLVTYKPEELLLSASNYLGKCADEKREEKFCKDPANFYGEDATYEDYLPKTFRDDYIGQISAATTKLKEIRDAIT